MPYLRQNLVFIVLNPTSRHPKKKFDENERKSRIQIEIIKKFSEVIYLRLMLWFLIRQGLPGNG